MNKHFNKSLHLSWQVVTGQLNLTQVGSEKVIGLTTTTLEAYYVYKNLNSKPPLKLPILYVINDSHKVRYNPLICFLDKQ
jgi:hypothetical protein